MEEPSTPTIAAANLMNDGIIILFEDGQCGFYDTVLLYSLLPEVEPLDDSAELW